MPSFPASSSLWFSFSSKLPGILLLLLLGSAPLLAQEKNVSKDSQQWMQYYHESKLSDSWSFLIDGGFRWKNAINDPSQYIIRTGAGYYLSPMIRVSAGFAHLGFYSGNKKNKIEYRPYQEILIKNKWQRLGISQRIRAEERFFKEVLDGEVQDPTAFNYRFRYALMARIPLFQLSPTHPDRKLVLAFGDEIFLNAGQEVTHNVFDQNRFILSPGLQYSKNLTFSFTWNRQFGSTSLPSEYKLSDVFWLQVKHQLDFRGGGS
ncbi:DUF2490 domain-containing protein [Algoriphagus sp. CAU 1675]|uniref:DUF2490 domain-containing protein n=1 Tax=Algoriphagus sp. CAU 1675 TaxID=3032597 RepID=UPI0023DB6771|nr:DUF2490 domain-containing protein [Algoriphagus sp. CAU 1675]MDF2157794.1 DUF2490 domain-containing protein [Algoriphagus sp. CAU 1675]